MISNYRKTKHILCHTHVTSIKIKYLNYAYMYGTLMHRDINMCIFTIFCTSTLFEIHIILMLLTPHA